MVVKLSDINEVRPRSEFVSENACIERMRDVNLSSMPTLSRTVNNQQLTINPVFQILGLLILVAFLSGCSIVGGNKPAALQVTATPEASVFLDGKHLGKTPFFTDQLDAKEYMLKITVSEASYTEKIVLTPGALTAVNRELSANFLGQSGETLALNKQGKGVFISSYPDKAQVSMDGKIAGETPLIVEDVKEGDHQVSLNKTGYIQREFTIKSSNKYQLTANVTLASEFAKGKTASSESQPQGKSVEILRTPLGFVRVRREPSLESLEIGTIETGKQAELLQEVQEWYSIKFDGKIGWISTQYAKKLL